MRALIGPYYRRVYTLNAITAHWTLAPKVAEWQPESIPPMAARPTDKADVERVYRLQRDPDPEEPEAPLVKSGIPHGRFVVTPVVDWAIRPAPTGRRKRPVPRWPRRSAPSPGSRAVPPRSPVEVTALGIAAPWPAWATGSVRVAAPWAGSAWPTGSVRVTGRGPAWATGSPRMIERVSAWVTGSAGASATGVTGSSRGSARTAGSAAATGPARIVGPGRWVEVSGRRSAMVIRGRRAVASGLSRRRRSRRGVCQTGAHTQRRSAKSTGDGSPRNNLLQFHWSFT